jgi:GGDEF domain-containing protein
MDWIVIAVAVAAACIALAASVVAVRARRHARRYDAAVDDLERQLGPIAERIGEAVERSRVAPDDTATTDPDVDELLERIAAEGTAVVTIRRIAEEAFPESTPRRAVALRGNRGDYDEELEREVARARRTGRPLSLVLLDVEEPTPDGILQLAALLTRVPRITDTVCRRRRDSFGILLPETAEDGARGFRERLDEEVALLGPSGRATFSTSIVQWRPNESGEALDARARAALESRTTGTGGAAAADTPA